MGENYSIFEIRNFSAEAHDTSFCLFAERNDRATGEQLKLCP